MLYIFCRRFVSCLACDTDEGSPRVVAGACVVLIELTGFIFCGRIAYGPARYTVESFAESWSRGLDCSTGSDFVLIIFEVCLLTSMPYR